MLPIRSLAAFMTALVVSSAVLLCIPATNAQTQSPPARSTPDSSAERANVPDQKLDATAAAMERVANLKQDYQQRIETAAESDKKRIAGEAQDALVKAVTDQGLSVEEYTSILTMAQSDAAVRDKLVQRLRPSK